MFIWLTAWDDEAEAAEFHKAYNSVVQVRYGDKITRAERKSGINFWKIGPEIAFVEQRGNRVLVIEAPAARCINPIRRQAWIDIQDEPAGEDPSFPPVRTPSTVIW